MLGPSLGATTAFVTAAPVAIATRVAVESESDLASSRLSMVIAGLLALAVVLTISTIVFWRVTRPDRPGGGEVGVRWIQPGDAASSPAAQSSTAQSSTAQSSTASPSAPQASIPPSDPDPPGDGPGVDYRAFRARPADG